MSHSLPPPSKPFPMRPGLGTLHLLRDTKGEMVVARYDSRGWSVFECRGLYPDDKQVAAGGYTYGEEMHLARRIVT